MDFQSGHFHFWHYEGLWPRFLRALSPFFSERLSASPLRRACQYVGRGTSILHYSVHSAPSIASYWSGALAGDCMGDAITGEPTGDEAGCAAAAA